MDIFPAAADVEGGMLHENQILADVAIPYPAVGVGGMPYEYEIVDYVVTRYRLISSLHGQIACYGEDIIKLLTLYAAFLAPIIGAVFAVEIVDKQRHCQTWWTLPVLVGLLSFSIGVALVSKLWQQFSLHKQRRQLEDEVNVQVELVINNVRAGTIWMNWGTLFPIQAMRADINQFREQRIGVLWYAERAALVVSMLGFLIVLLISCTRLRC